MLIFRADTGPDIGAGHIFRCAALAEQCEAEPFCAVGMWRTSSVPAVFDGRHIPLTATHPDPLDLATVTALVEQHSESWVVCDAYQIDGAYVDALRGAGAKVLQIDDVRHAHYYCPDLLLNQNLDADRLAYARAPWTRLLLGPSYALIRREFRAVAPAAVSAQACRVLVTMGGGGQSEALISAVEGLAAVEETLDVTVVCGAVPPAEVEAALVARPSRHRVRFIGHGPMAELMAHGDLAVTGAGSTCWELCAMGVPFVTVVLAGNQALIADALARAGVSVNLGPREQVGSPRVGEVVGALVSNHARRKEMSARGRALVDGLGAARVYATLRPGARPCSH